MKDIVLTKKKPSFKRAVSLPSQQIAGTYSFATQLIERFLVFTGQCATSLYLILNRGELHTQKISFKPLKEKPSIGKLLHAKAATAGDRVRTKTKKAHLHAKTPLGKLALTQAVAIVALFAYVNLHQTEAPTPSAKNVSQSVEQANLQRYLPAVGQYTEPRAFETTEVINSPDSSLGLYTWLTPWNTDAIKSNIQSYTSVSAFWLTVSENGTTFTPKSSWSAWQAFAKDTSKKPTQDYFLTVSGDPDHVFVGISSPDQQKVHIQNLLQVVKEQDFDGIDVDYEGLGESNRVLFTDFIRNLTAAFHAENKKVAVTVEARLNNQVPMDWRSLSSLADEIRLMVYDYHGQTTGTPGPITPIGWLKEVLDYSQQNTTLNKVVVGLGNYGYDWVSTQEGDALKWRGSGISFEQAMAISTDMKIPVVRATGIDERGYDIGSIPTYTYKDASQNTHSVWFEDSTSLQAKTTLVKQYPVKGIIFWSVGLGDRSFWQASN